MSPAIQQFFALFAATIPLIGWAAFQQNSRFDGIDRRLDRIDKRLDDLGEDLKSLGVRVNEHDVRIAKVETRLDNPRLFTK
jgi:hypothetical protein